MKNVKKLLVLLMAIMMMFCMSAMVFADGETPVEEEMTAGLDIPYGVYEPVETLLYESARGLKISCEKVHVTNTFTAEVFFSSEKYTKLVMDGVTYAPYVTTGRSTFIIPITPGKKLEFKATTTAMSGETEITYGDDETIIINLDKDNLKAAASAELQDGYYTTTVNSNKETYGYVIGSDGSRTYGFSYPKANYDFPVTVQVKDGKIVDVAYTNKVVDLVANTSSDINYLMWAMDGHNVTDHSYNYLAAAGKNYEKYHVMPPKNGVGLRDQIVEKNGINNVDSVTAATITSRAIVNSVDQSIIKAERGQKDDPDPVLPQPDTSEDVIPADGVYFVLGDVACIGASVDCDVAPMILYVEGGKIKADMGVEQNPSSYPHIYAGTEKEALEAGEEGWLVPANYDYGYVSSSGKKTPGSMYKDVPIKSLDKKLNFVMFAGGSGNWFNRLITIKSEDLVKIPQEADKAKYTEESYNAVAEAFANFKQVRDNAESAEPAISAAKETLVAALDALERVPAYTPAEDNGDRKNQNDVSNNIVYSSIGMFRILDEGTSVTKNEDGTVTVKIKTNPLASGTYEKMALTEYPTGTAAEIEAELNELAFDADKIEETDGQNGQTGEPAKVYSSEFTFTIKADEVGKMIPFVYTQNGKWRTKSYYLIVLTDAEAAARQEEIKKAEEEAAAKEEATNKANAAVEDAEKIDASGYTAESYAKVTAAVEALKEVLANPDATAEEIAAAEAALDKAISELKTPSVPAAAKKANPMKVKAVKKTFKVKVLKKKAKTFKAVKVTGYKGKLSYVGKPVGKKAKKYLKFNKKTGKITVKKGAKKGKYKMKVTVKAAGNASYKAGKKTVTVVVTVKK